MAAKTSWHRYGTKLRRCHPMCTGTPATKDLSTVYGLIRRSLTVDTASSIFSGWAESTAVPISPDSCAATTFITSIVSRSEFLCEITVKNRCSCSVVSCICMAELGILSTILLEAFCWRRWNCETRRHYIASCRIADFVLSIKYLTSVSKHKAGNWHGIRTLPVKCWFYWTRLNIYEGGFILHRFLFLSRVGRTAD